MSIVNNIVYIILYNTRCIYIYIINYCYYYRLDNYI